MASNELSAIGNEPLDAAAIFGGKMFEVLKPLQLIYLIIIYAYHAILSYGDTDAGSAELDSIEQVLNSDLNGDGTIGGQTAASGAANSSASTSTRSVRGRAAARAASQNTGG